MHERNVTSAQGTPWPWCVAACKLQPCIGRRCLFSVSCSALLTPKLLYRSPRLLPYQRWTVAPQRPTGCELCEPTPPAGVRSMARGPSVNATLAPRAATCKLRLYPPAGSQRDALSGPSLLCRRRHLLTHAPHATRRRRRRRDACRCLFAPPPFALPAGYASRHHCPPQHVDLLGLVSRDRDRPRPVRDSSARRGTARHAQGVCADPGIRPAMFMCA